MYGDFGEDSRAISCRGIAAIKVLEHGSCIRNEVATVSKDPDMATL